ncbi:MAG: membrane protein insertase YidC [Bacteroidales bacterium]|nr:membrane protein insertase YidC [Bacteroidales bacterium]
MNKKTIIGLVLIFGIFVLYMIWMFDPEQAHQQHIQDSLYQDSLYRVEQAEQQRQNEQKRLDSLKAMNVDVDTSNTPTIQKHSPAQKDSLGTMACNLDNPVVNITVQNGVSETRFSSKGASIQEVILNDYVTFDSLPLRVVTPSEDNLNLLFVLGEKKVYSRQVTFVPFINDEPVAEDRLLEVAEDDSLTIAFRAFVADNDSAAIDPDHYLEFRYVVHSNSYETDFDIEFHNIAQQVGASSLELTWSNNIPRQEKNDKSRANARNLRNANPERFFTSMYYKTQADRPHNLKDGNDSDKQLTVPVEWIAYKQQFFCSALMSDSAFSKADNMQQSFKDTSMLCHMSSRLGIDYYAGNNESVTVSMRFFHGPNRYRTLRQMGHGMDRLLPLGWGFFLTQWTSRFLIIPLFNFLSKFISNYGIIIIVLTLIFKIILLPLTYPSYKTSAVMRHLRPEMDAISKKYPDQDQMMQKQQAMSALQKKAGINPLAGCLPALIQFPILWAMFRFFPASIELRQEAFLWCDDLSSYDSILSLGNNGIPGYGNHVSLFCLIMFAVQMFYTWWTMRQQQAQAQMPGMKLMMYMMPVMMLFFLNNQSAALNIYYCVNLLFTMLIMWGIRIFVTEKRVRKTMEKNSAKMMKKGNKQKKSKFQQRLEEMQKMADQMQKQQQSQRKH